MAKQLLKERFQQLAGIKPLYEQEDDKGLKNKLLSIKDKIENHPLMQKAIDKIINSPKLSNLLQKAASKLGLNESFNEEIDIDSIIAKSKEMAFQNKDKLDKLNEDDDGGTAVSIGLGMMFLPMLFKALGINSLFTGIMAASGLANPAALMAIAGIFIGLLVVGVKRKMQGNNL